MKRILFILPVFFLFFTGCDKSPKEGTESVPAIIPAPLSLTPGKGHFRFTDRTMIIIPAADGEARLAASLLATLSGNPTGIVPEIVEGDKPKRGSVFMAYDRQIANAEGYVLDITSKHIKITAGTAAGFFYAVQSLRQLMPPAVEEASIVDGLEISVPACLITDEPAFGYRGMHLDVGRHMFPVAAIKKYIDMLALHKMNTFHWHLTEDQGWRIEIKKYPALTETGAYRNETVIGHAGRPPLKYDGTRYGGFYTQEEVKEVVAYAKERFITVIPEIEMPGHALAALASYPELSCTGGPFEVGEKWGVYEDIFCAGREETFTFLQDVLSEVISLFPGTYIHIGGDEAPKARWEKCRLCQKRIRDEGLADEHELQSYFIQRIEKFLLANGKRLIGWDEILEGGLAPEATVMSWRGIKGGIAAAKEKHDVIMTPNSHVYLDYYQAEPAGEPLAIGGYLPLEKVYSFNPLPAELTPEEQKHILGVQGNVWTEYIATPEHMEYMAFPRAFAIAETGWTPDRLKDFEDFLARLEVQKKRYDVLNLNYFRGEYRNTRAAGSK
ncbi:MAG TPA: beta-N-acetylhexosaminidase [Bacteroidales bacterium]|mgnify:CR=1 FL=1|nr:beta-N-acetylhexosaminidase [Bacteroidales bacterium]HPF03677.1 beta-N-acetylhexosaminidase [Bacteroidales bacterium]HPJ59145.1 beta-N-acetylhexosaminidase [Bacteroidales bacterium]HPR12757.1 beta-N-acetylhexosaminidase [Bacteroidales bacterium]HRW84361.1 beta-N-acetylhexosaminidase [Bacteroidales bacterium]